MLIILHCPPVETIYSGSNDLAAHSCSVSTTFSLCLQVTFEDVIAEPVSVRSGDRVWIWSNALYEVSRVWVYRIVTVLLAIPASIISGLLFAILSCLHIW